MEWKKLLSFETQVEKEKEPDDFEKYPISELEKDYKAIISSAAFRRLQDKTQVFPLDKSDFVRTRLTHSIEVSTIARQLGIMLTKNTSQYLQTDFRENEQIVDEIPIILSCAGLLHDIGNPPFGHFGEVVIGEWFKNEFMKERFSYKGRPVREILQKQMKMDLENFEGNAQALRILSKVTNKQEGYDVNLTYGVLNTLVKYPTSSIEFDGESKSVKKHKLGYFYAERNIMKLICNATGTAGGEEYSRHPLVYLMEAADDIAYATADLEDAFKKGMFTIEQFIDFFDEQTRGISNVFHKKYTEELIANLKERIQSKKRTVENDLAAFQRWTEFVQKWLMYVVVYRFSKNYDEIMAGAYEEDMFFETNHHESIKILKRAMKEFVYDNNEILKLELSAKKIIESLMNDFIYAALYWGEEEEATGYGMTKADRKLMNIISANYKEDYLCAKTENEAENLYLRFLMVTDYISGMTDSYAKNLYQELNGLT